MVYDSKLAASANLPSAYPLKKSLAAEAEAFPEEIRTSYLQDSQNKLSPLDSSAKIDVTSVVRKSSAIPSDLIPKIPVRGLSSAGLPGPSRGLSSAALSSANRLSMSIKSTFLRLSNSIRAPPPPSSPTLSSTVNRPSNSKPLTETQKRILSLKGRGRTGVYEAHPLYPDVKPETLETVVVLERKALEELQKKDKYENAIGGTDFIHVLKAEEEDLDPRQNSVMASIQSKVVALVLLGLLGLAAWSAYTWYKETGTLIGIFGLIIFPLNVLFIMFPIQVVYSNILMMFGPISWLERNTHTYSGVAPSEKLIEHFKKNKLPKVTIQIPVYKESLDLTIRPTVLSALEAVKAYRKEGGEANIFINDDGLVLLSEEDRRCRLMFYRDYEIGYVARPAANRAGKFKKASNMNYGLTKAIALQQLMQDEGLDYATALHRFIYSIDMDREYGQIFVGGNILVGDFILLLDSDSRVPPSCILPVMAEFSVNPKLAFTQHFTTPMQIQHDYWENMISKFTNLIYDVGISLPVAWGFAPPLVGHNAFLRWSAIKNVTAIDNKYWNTAPVQQEAPVAATRINMSVSVGNPAESEVTPNSPEMVSAKPASVPAASAADPSDAEYPFGKNQHDYYKFWSEEHVSEDFQMFISLMQVGFFGRYVRYTGDGFKEGVSLTIHEEVRKMQKFAFGVVEMLFNPVYKWIYKTPFSPLFYQYIFCRQISFADKLSTMSYCGTYLAISFGLLGSLIYYSLHPFLNHWRAFLVDPIDVVITCTIVFGALCFVSSAVFGYRRGKGNVLRLMVGDIKFILFMTTFFCGLGYHTNIMILKYLFGLKAEWGSTVKEVENTNFFKEVRRTVLGYKWMYLFYILLSGVVALMWFFPAPYTMYRIRDLHSIIPLCMHIFFTCLMPVLLNPVLMRVKF